MAEPLQKITDIWTRQIEAASKAKEFQFGGDARRIWRFYGERSHHFLYLERPEEEGGVGEREAPYYRATLNKTFEFASVMLPYIFHRVPVRAVYPKRMPWPFGPAAAPEAAQPTPNDIRASLMSWMLNLTPRMFGLREEGRLAVTEALIKGRGLLWTEIKETPRGPLIGSFFGSVDGLLIDPDATSVTRASWIARFRRRPAWEVADEWEIDPKELKKQAGQTRSEAAERAAKENPGQTTDNESDAIEYWEIYSRCGLGQNFSAMPYSDETFTKALDAVGDNVFLAIVPGMAYPLNLRPKRIRAEGADYIREQTRWPLPFYLLDGSPWPFTPLDFHVRPGRPWPTSPLKPALPLQAFLDYAWSWLMGRIKQTGRLIPVVDAAAQEEFKQAIETGRDLEVVYVKSDSGLKISDIYSTIVFPEMSGDLWRTIAGIEEEFNAITGMAPLLRGDVGATQPRSAEEIEARRAGSLSRPDEYADCVEEFSSLVAAKEGMATRRAVSPSTIAMLAHEPPVLIPTEENPFPELGPVTKAWADLVAADTDEEAMAQLDYTVQAQSGRRPNKSRRQIYLKEMGQIVLPQLVAIYQSTGNPDALNGFLRAVADAYDADPRPLLLPRLTQEPPSPEQQQGGQ